MSLTTQLIKKVLEEKKKKAQDEMGVPKYDNFGTPDNHVGKKKTKTVSNPGAGLGDRKDKKPTADVGSARKEKGRDMEGTKQKPKKMSEAAHPAMRDLGINISNGMLQFHPPGQPDNVHSFQYDKNIHQFLVRSMAQHPDTESVFQLLMDYFEEGEGQDPYQQQGLTASIGPDIDLEEGPDDYPFHRDMAQQQTGRQTMGPQGSTVARSNVGAGKKATFGGGGGRETMNLRNSVGESAHKSAAGEMDKGKYSTTKGDPARTAKTRTSQNDAPTNKGDPGTPKKSEKRAGQGGRMDPNPVTVHQEKGGENTHKSMNKMHENVKALEGLLGRKLKLGKM